jgi:hypothetical protein
MMSGVPPAASETIIRTGFTGQVCADAGWANAATSASNAPMSLMGVLPRSQRSPD